MYTLPLTEPLFVLLFVLSVHFFIQWVATDDSKYLFLLGVAGFFEILTRYDGWFITALTAFLILAFQLIHHKRKLNEAIDKLIIFLFPVLFGVALWLIWNLLIFGNPLYFLFGQYSAKSQQGAIAASVGLVAKGNLGMSFITYWYDMLANVGIYVMITAFIGTIIYFLDRKVKGTTTNKLLVIVLLSSPVVFNILALYLGFSIISIPQLHLSTWRDFSDQWFNVRYGVFVLPFVAVGMGFFANFKKTFAVIALLIVLFQGVVLINHYGIITVTDGTIGSSAFVNQDIATQLKNNVKPDDKVILSTSFFNPVMFKSGLNLINFVHEGISNDWHNSLVEPEKYAKWIVMSNGYAGEPVYESLVIKQNNAFLYFYKLEHKGNHANIYELKNYDELTVRKENINLMIGDKDFVIKGVDSFDLAYETDDQINTIFKELKSTGINTVRFDLFGDGIIDGFQPEAGIMNEVRLKKTDLIISLAQKYNIKLIPVLIDGMSDHGGPKQYLEWTGNDISNQDLFFSNPDTTKLFENYINHVVTRKNTITKRSYSEEPSILAWEIINEYGSTETDYPLYYNWTNEISAYIKQLDSNHLVTTGSTSITSSSSGNTNSICEIQDIDLCQMTF